MSAITKIEPRTLRGFRDFLPPQMIQRQLIISQVRRVYESFGYLPLETPVLEYADILKGKYGEEADSLLYEFEDNGQRKVAMRYDLTVPLSRVVSMYPDLPKPFKRYQVAPVWRAEKTQKGRFREFVQFDADICGSSSIMADAEIVAIIYEVMMSLGINRFKIEINNRKILNGLIVYAGLDPISTRRVFQVIDKLAKIGFDGVRKELLSEKEDYRDKETNGVITSERIILPGFEPDKVEKIMDFVAIGAENKQLLETLSEMFKGIEVGMEGVKELRQVLDYATAMGVNEDNIKIKPSIARGLDYYTGTVYETTLLDKPDFGSVFSGGRFDELIGMFTGKNVPAVGASVGVDRLFAAMTELDLLPVAPTISDILVTVLPGSENFSLKVARELRRANKNIELFLGEVKKEPLKAQLKYADIQKIPYVVFCFPENEAGDICVLRSMAEKNQKNLPLVSLVEEIKNIKGGGLFAERASENTT